MHVPAQVPMNARPYPPAPRLVPGLGILPLVLSLLLSACTTSAVTPLPATAPPPVYDYPFANPWVATVVGTPADQKIVFPDEPRPVRRQLAVFPGRAIPEGFWYYEALNYSVLLQPGPAPLVFVIAGTGASDRSRLTTALGHILHAQGMHVVLLPSPTHANFIVTASENFLPGLGQQDATDLLRVMHGVKDQLADTIAITGYGITGYSLGAWHAAFTAEMDSRQPDGFGFDRVLLVNPPVSLYRSIGEIDAMLLKALPDGADSIRAFLDKAISRLTQAYTSTDALDFTSQDLALETYRALKPSDASLATAIGLSFRLSTMNMIFTSDVMSHAGYIFPADRTFESDTETELYVGVALRTSFLDYFGDIFSEYYMARTDEWPDREALIAQSSLESIGGWLSANPDAAVVTNADDVILAEGDLEKLEQLFQGRATVFPTGGHMGNMQHRAFAAAVARFFAR
ncbi:alpha/beta hydrolase [Geminicoccus roseus]|uniref:alpha/beta hydrolase n=1 Tax=Geminicoccus roseus TaxID=404900 RepID=UPI0012FACAB4|nr:alpha/beta hydrolase [Geminicoccus roseus]